MFNQRLLNLIDIKRFVVKSGAYHATGLDNETIKTAEFDTRGAQTISFLVLFSDMDTIDIVVKVQESDTTNDLDFTDVTGATVTVNNDDNKMVAIEVPNTGKKYLRLHIAVGNGGSTSTIGGILGMLYGTKTLGITQSTAAGQFDTVVIL
jgi:hypothetical protein